MSSRRKSKATRPVVNFDILEQINCNAAGLDIGAAEIWAAVPPDRTDQPVQMFPTFTADLHRLANWLEACGIKTVAMESTGVYWIPIYDILEARGFQVYLVNARHIKNVTGRKSDILDCQSPKGRRSALDPPAPYLWLAQCLLPARQRHGHPPFLSAPSG